MLAPKVPLGRMRGFLNARIPVYPDDTDAVSGASRVAGHQFEKCRRGRSLSVSFLSNIKMRQRVLLVVGVPLARRFGILFAICSILLAILIWLLFLLLWCITVTITGTTMIVVIPITWFLHPRLPTQNIQQSCSGVCRVYTSACQERGFRVYCRDLGFKP